METCGDCKHWEVFGTVDADEDESLHDVGICLLSSIDDAAKEETDWCSRWESLSEQKRHCPSDQGDDGGL